MDKISVRSDVSGKIKAPSSKSYAQRAVAASLLAEGETTLLNMELCSDTRAALSVVEALGASVAKKEDGIYVIKGGISGGRLVLRDTIVNICESGLSTRMFTPIASLYDTEITIMGEGSILKRPMEMMAEPLRSLGVNISSDNGYLPLKVRGSLKGGEVCVDGSLSSQFVTGLLMSLPLAETDTTIHVESPKSIPYINMTIDLLKNFGIEIAHNDDYTEFYIESGQSYKPAVYNVEGDWSGASCVLVAGAIAGEVTVENLNPLSMQADIAIIEALSKAGAEIVTTPDSVTVRNRPLSAFEFDATHCPDLFPALAALAANCEGRSVIRGTERLTHKESNRAEVLKEEFGKMGIEIDISEQDLMYVTGGQIKSAVVDSHNDHRIAMATAVAGLTSDGQIVIQGAEAVDKSYTRFWDDLASLTKEIK